MNRLLFLALAFLVVANVNAQDAEVVESIRDKAATDWPNDCVTQQFQIEEESKAAKAVEKYRREFKGDSQRYQIYEKAVADWPNDYTTMRYQIQQEAKSISKNTKDEEGNEETAESAAVNERVVPLSKMEIKLETINDRQTMQLGALKVGKAELRKSLTALTDQYSNVAEENFQLKYFALRVWTAENDASTTVGTMIKCGKTSVDIRKVDGSKVRVQLTALSKANQALLKTYRALTTTKMVEKK